MKCGETTDKNIYKSQYVGAENFQKCTSILTLLDEHPCLCRTHKQTNKQTNKQTVPAPANLLSHSPSLRSM